MIIMKYLFGIITTTLVILSFTNHKCEHVFTQVEQAAIKIERPDLYGSMTLPAYHWPTGTQQGKELICVKCFHVQKQVLDYGKPDTQRSLVWPDTSPLNILCDTVSSMGVMFLKVDSLIMRK